MTIAPNSAIVSVTPASTALWVGPPASGLFVVIQTPSGITVSGSQPLLRCAFAGMLDLARSVSSSSEETGLFHQDFVTLFFGLDPFGVLSPGQEGRVEGAVLHEVLPLGCGPHLLEQLDVILDLV